MKKYNHADGNNPTEIMTFLEKYATQNFESEKQKADYIKELYAKCVDFLEGKKLDCNQANIEANIEAIKAHTILPKIEEKKPCGCQEKAQSLERPCYERPCFWAVLAGVVVITALTTYAITDFFKDSK